MEHKVLIADDSLTIQKVIKITLANEPFELHDCSDAADLVEAVKSIQPAMVLLDFNLSENKTGYDLCREIKSVNSDIGVLMLFGTFDTIDEGLLADCGCNYHIVKPFDGTKFINLCRALAADFESEKQNVEGEQDFSTGSIELEEEASPTEEQGSGEFGEEEWVVNQPGFQEEASVGEPSNEDEEAAEAPSKTEQNKLEMEVEDWGMEIPAIIGTEEDESAMELPGVIGEEPALEAKEPTIETKDETVLPASEDLEYPEMGVMTEGEEPKSKLVPMEDLSSAGEEIELEEKYSSGGTDTEEGVKKLEDQIRDEIEEDEDLWAADVVEESSETASEEKAEEKAEEESFQPFDSEHVDSVEVEDLAPIQPHGLHEVKEEAHEEKGTPSDFPADVMDEEEAPKEQAKEALVSEKVLEEMAEKVQARVISEVEKEFSAQLSPLVERFVKEYCKEQIEKVAWEVIPDLAENIIKKEIQKISDSIMD